MIWVLGEIVPEDAIKISVLDRTFEHGLGLFETLRTWNGHPTLLPGHLERIQQSAQALRLPLDPTALPDAQAVEELRKAEGIEGDARLRITLSGGISESQGATLWMRAWPIPPASLGATIPSLVEHIDIDYDDPLTRHKTLNYWRRRLVFEDFERRGIFGECLSMTGDRCFWEGMRSNVFWIEGQTLMTPGPDGPFLKGIMRGVVLERARLLGLDILEKCLTYQNQINADEAFMTNAVRGLIPIVRFGDKDLPAPGPWTHRLWDNIRPWLESGGLSP